MQNNLTSLIASSTHPALFAEVCRAEVAANPDGVLDMIRMQIKDGRNLVIEMFGEEVVVIIEKMEV
jgi:hypothetical protein